ncbi:hypothetical protein D6T63_00170 [Arthrobacter cheniae]|uniref:Uncharacterized protein n=1 Tax=Arthrobacter cheniae TaxID=1258888 RepID=A0A3A5MBD4_9MICC|nr:hypothetical protein [Arthrobacter cheniae]RJT82919.1 hypothetical protein D6T63_00170 [Arthrobacter cheniae]
MYPGFDIVPLDGAPSDSFTGVDFTASVRGPSIYDTSSVQDQVLEAVEEELTKAGFATRRCRLPGVGSSATGAPAFYEFLKWVHENWDFLKGVTSTIVSWVVFVQGKAHLLERTLNDRLLDPYRPSVFVDLLVRTTADGSEKVEDAATSLGAFLQYLPRLSARLVEEFREQSFTLRVSNKSGILPYTHFKVAKIRRSDAAKMVRYMNAHRELTGVKAVLLYRQFGVITRLRPVRSMEEFFRLMMGR